MALHVVRFNKGAPVYVCRVCQTPFFEGEDRAYEQHVIACATNHEEELRELSLRVKAPALFDPDQSGDVEFGKWVRGNRKALIEGRLKM